jgi:hypothetical protein
MVQQPHDEPGHDRPVSDGGNRQPVTPAPDDTAPWETVVQRLAAHEGRRSWRPVQFVFASPLITVSPEAMAYAAPPSRREPPCWRGPWI